MLNKALADVTADVLASSYLPPKIACASFSVISLSPYNAFSNFKVYEGTLVNNKYTVDTSNADHRFLIKNDMSDTTTLQVKVQNSSGDSTSTT